MEPIITNPLGDDFYDLAQVILENLQPLPIIEYEENE